MDRLWVQVPAAAILLGIVCALAARQSLLIGIIAAVLFGAAGAILLLRRILSVSSSVTTAANAVASGTYSARALGRGSGELGELTDAFNAMAQRVQSEMAVASEGRHRLMAALDSSVDPILALDNESRVLFANLASQRLFEQDVRAMVGTPAAWLLPDEHVVEAVRASRERGIQSTIDIERPGRRFFQVVTSPIAGGGEWAVLIVIHDESDRRRTDLVRRDFIANVSHELRTPLAGIKAVIETLAEGALDDREAATDFLSRADSEVDRLILLVEELLELSRIESGEIPLTERPTDVVALLREVVERLQPQAERRRLSLSVDQAGNPGLVLVDPVRIESAVVNLVQNALKFTPEGGSVMVAAEREGEELRIRVSDTGIGIDTRVQGRIFERFYKADQSRTSQPGSGIGLAIVKHTAEAHGGRVAVESQLGSGSTFSMYLPFKS